MSIDTWVDEYYENIESAIEWSDLQRFKHTLKKYTGLNKENLENHEVTLNPVCTLINDRHFPNVKADYFNFDINTCSLCIKYYNSRGKCVKCPVYKHTGLDCQKNYSHYIIFRSNYDPKPIIGVMKELISKCDNEGNYIK